MRHADWPFPNLTYCSISYPTEAVKILAAQKGWKVVVVADKKTPADWAYPNVDFLSVEMQQSLPYEITPLVPYNNYGCAA
jgi:hypothetical protein